MRPATSAPCLLHVCPLHATCGGGTLGAELSCHANPFAVTDEERGTYTRIIDGILAAADLETVTRKKIRQGLEEAIDKDLSDQKVCAGPSTLLPNPSY